MTSKTFTRRFDLVFQISAWFLLALFAFTSPLFAQTDPSPSADELQRQIERLYVEIRELETSGKAPPLWKENAGWNRSFLTISRRKRPLAMNLQFGKSIAAQQTVT